MPAVWKKLGVRASPYSHNGPDKENVPADGTNSTDYGTMFSSTSVADWESAEADNHAGLRVERSIDPSSWQTLADNLYRKGKANKEDDLQKKFIDLNVPEALLQARIKTAAVAVSRGLPPALAKLVREDAEALASAIHRLVPQARTMIMKIELFAESVCSRWHQDNYVCRGLVSYNLSGTEYTANSNVNFDELLYCGNNDHIIRDKSQILSANVGDIVLIKGKKYPRKVKGLVHKSPTVQYDTGGVQTRILLKLDIQDLVEMEVANNCDGD